jgi:hypothetical protein
MVAEREFILTNRTAFIMLRSIAEEYYPGLRPQNADSLMLQIADVYRLHVQPCQRPHIRALAACVGLQNHLPAPCDTYVPEPAD